MKRLLFIFLIILSSCEKDPVKFSLSVNINPIEGGIVNPASGSYESGETVTIFAQPNRFYAFKNWSGQWSGSEPTIILTIDSDKNIIANFEKNDNDEDGVVNLNDLCPGTSFGESVDSSGCGLSQRDTDGDGVTDDLDLCPNTVLSSIPINSNGCEVSLFYLADNGTTIKAIQEAEVGSEQEFNGKLYKLVDRNELEDLILSQSDLSSVVTSKITDMNRLFMNQGVNSNISTWDVSNVTNMKLMFTGSNFNQDISSWDVSNVTDMGWTFAKTPFNKPIGDWDVSKVTTMEVMFLESSFNQDISNWNTSNVINMSSMFSKSPFNQDISNWNTSNVIYMSSMFSKTPFNQNISSWDVSNVTQMAWMFQETPFNQDIGNWDVSNVELMPGMFFMNQSFNQDLSNWNVQKVTWCGVFNSGATNFTLPKPNFINCNPNDG